MTKLGAFALLAACACATAPTQDRTTQDRTKEKVVLFSTPGAPVPEGKVVCSVERPTGSNIAERICRYENQADWSSARTQDALLGMQRQPCVSKSGCGP